jgi:hypothetical protein
VGFFRDLEVFFEALFFDVVFLEGDFFFACQLDAACLSVRPCFISR